VTVRSGGAGHAHSGIVKTSVDSKPDAAAVTATKGKTVRLGR
jgi:hypothetical protein